MREHKILAFIGCLVGMLLLLGLAWGAETQAGSKPKETKKETQSNPRHVLKPPSKAVVKRPSTQNPPAISLSRDPFRTLVIRQSDGSQYPALPGKQGLVISQMQVKGIIKAGGENLAVVGTPQSPAAIFLHKDDEVFNGTVLAIDDSSVLFRERMVDPLGKPFTREVLKKLSGSTGVSQ